MLGQKDYTEKLFTNFRLSERVPQNNFYRRLKGVLDLNYLYKSTRLYYGRCGQKSIDPVVFFKLCLVGYLENITSDRQLIEHCSMRMDILFFLGYGIDEELPWHSTVSRTRQLFPADIFEGLFTRVFSLCAEKGMVAGHTQATDSAPIKANASMDSLELKVPAETLADHLMKVRHISEKDKKNLPCRKAKNNKAPEKQQQVTASREELNGIKARNKKWANDQDTRQGSGNPLAKYTSNKTHYSPTDPDARISVKPGKARKLNYHGNICVDTAHHVITDACAYHADRVDSQNLQDIATRVKGRLNHEGFLFANLLADAGYSSGENYAFLEQQGITSYIPQHGTYKGGPDGFTFHKDGNYWECTQGRKVTFHKQREVKGTLQDHYYTKRSDCKDCPLKAQCIGKSYEKKIAITVYAEEYKRNNKRVKSKYGRLMKKKRQSTVEPVWGTLTQFMGLRKINTIGIGQANKAVQMAACAYNLKKLVKFIKADMQIKAQSAQVFVKQLFLAFSRPFAPL